MTVSQPDSRQGRGITNNTGLIYMKLLPESTMLLFFLSGFFLLSACSPTVKVETPDKPITINLNIKIQHEIRIKVDKELEDVFSKDSGLF